jgi:hypothetical protein
MEGIDVGGLVQVLGPLGLSTIRSRVPLNEAAVPGLLPWTVMSMWVDPLESTHTAAAWLTLLALLAQRPTRLGSHDWPAYVGSARAVRRTASTTL